MAKEQNLSLNPNKISGVCGRLMCCLKYEQDQYEAVRKKMPKVGKEVVTPDGNGIVWDLNVIKETVRVRIQKGDSSELRDYPMEDVQRVGQHPNPQPAKAAQAEEKPAPAQEHTDDSEEKTDAKPRREQNARPRSEEGEKPNKGERRERRRDERRKPEKQLAEAAADERDKTVEKESPVAENGSKTEAETPAASPAPAAEPVKDSADDWKAALARAMAEAGN